MIDRSLMNQLTRMLTSLNMYTMLEVPLLQETNEYYLAEGKAFMDSCDVSGTSCLHVLCRCTL